MDIYLAGHEGAESQQALIGRVVREFMTAGHAATVNPFRADGGAIEVGTSDPKIELPGWSGNPSASRSG
jgi:hypothetical protein